jgi:hypothetical protein
MGRKIFKTLGKGIASAGKSIKSATYNAASTKFRTMQGKNLYENTKTTKEFKQSWGTKVTPSFLRSKTVRQAIAASEKIYGTSNISKTQVIAQKQTAYNAAVKAQKDKVEAASKTHATTTSKINPFGSKFSFLSPIKSLRNKRALSVANSTLKNQQSILKALESKKAEYNKKASSLINAVAQKRSLTAETTVNGKTTKKTLQQLLTESKDKYTAEVEKPIMEKRGKFEAAVGIKKGINSEIVKSQLAYQTATGNILRAASPEEKSAAILALKEAEGTLKTTKAKAQSTEYLEAAKQAQTLGKELVKTRKINLLTVNNLNKIRLGKNNGTAIASAKKTAFTSSILLNRKQAKHSSLDKLKQFGNESSQQKLVQIIERANILKKKDPKSLTVFDFRAIRRGVKSEAILKTLGELGDGVLKVEKPVTLLSSEANAKLPVLSEEQKQKGIADLQVNIKQKDLQISQAAQNKAIKAAKNAQTASNKLKSQGKVGNFFTFSGTKAKVQKAVTDTQALAVTAQSKVLSAKQAVVATGAAAAGAAKAVTTAEAAKAAEVAAPKLVPAAPAPTVTPAPALPGATLTPAAAPITTPAPKLVPAPVAPVAPAAPSGLAVSTTPRLSSSNA